MDVTIIAVDPDAPKITLNSPVDGNTFKIGDKMLIKATIDTTEEIAGIEYELHGNEEYSVENDLLNGQKGHIDYSSEMTISTEMIPGTYHFHFTVKTVSGKETTAEAEDITITK